MVIGDNRALGSYPLNAAYYPTVWVVASSSGEEASNELASLIIFYLFIRKCYSKSTQNNFNIMNLF